ncbi:MAG: flagellar hook-associated protein FlgK [Lachnospiraceae bacterium]|nr:flagellar hook-associated protein FlgK [Lachnospiraceae bacterium]
MPSTFLGLNTGMSGLGYYQATLNTTAHNISNADVKGYSRQVVNSQASYPIRVNSAYGMMGTGVEMTGIDQQRNVYYDTKYHAATSKYNEYEAVKEQLTQLQTYLNEMQSETGYTKLMAKISSAMQDLASSPADPTYRTQFNQAMKNFTDLIKETSVNYQNTQRDINNEVAIHVDTINSIASQIYTLNQQIMNIETRWGNANDLRDQREVLVDQLSELVNVTVTEVPIMYGYGGDATKSGASRYEVRIGSTVLVDEMECKQLKVAARQEKINQNDIDGLYDVYWEGLNGSLGEEFNFNSANVTGRIKGLLEVRDGNNFDPFSGTIESMTSTTTGEASSVVVSVKPGVSVDKLNLPQDGIITLNCKDYYYEGFEATVDADGLLTSFTFKNVTVPDDEGKRVPAQFDTSLDVGKEALMGERIDCQGIPYYMTQLNEFVRTFSNYMNDLFTSGADANGDAGLDYFTTPDVRGVDRVLTTRDTTTGDIIKPTEIKSSESNYYQITALNWSINESVMANQEKLVVSYKEDIEQHNKEAKGVLEKVIAGLSDRSMYAQGTPTQFLQSITTSQAVDISKFESFSKNMDEVSTVINKQRQSISSVDTNEEAAHLVMYQNGYNLSSKVISILNQVYDKLINQTGI